MSKYVIHRAPECRCRWGAGLGLLQVCIENAKLHHHDASLHCTVYRASAHFWRTSAGTEVDIVVEAAGTLIPIEVKVSATPRVGMASSIKGFLEDVGDRARPGYVIHPGDVRLPLGSKVTALPFAEL